MVTLFTSLAIVCVVTSVFTWFLHAYNRSIHGIVAIASSNTCFAVGFGLIVFRSSLSGFLSFIVANSLIAIAHILIIVGIQQFTGRRTHPVIALIVIGIYMMVFSYWYYVDDNFKNRLVIFLTTYATMMLYALTLTLSEYLQTHLKSYLIATLFIGMLSALFYASAVISVFSQHGHDILAVNRINESFVLEHLFFMVGWTLSFSLMVSERLFTEKSKAEEEVRRLNTNLERLVTERTAELIAANQELESFAFAVSHDLRAPLRAINGYAGALIEDYGHHLESEPQKYLHQITESSRKMGELIDGILALSRCARGELRRDRVDISALSGQLLEELQRADPQRAVSWAVEPNLRAIGDARLIEAVLSNLLSNAWKYTGKTSSPEIRVFAGHRDGRRGFCVSDNGAGFDMAHARNLFQPFKRLHRADEFPGIGIGLATAQRILRRHGGDISGEGEVGVGAAFFFSLPLS